MKDYPKIELLDAQPADWDTPKAAELMSSYLTKYGDKIKGVHCANDNMAYGVLAGAEGRRHQRLPVVGLRRQPRSGRDGDEG